MASPIIGIDLGTTNSVVSILQNNIPLTVLVDGEKLLPSAVCLTEEGFIVGKMAKNMAMLEPDSTILSVKRKMGQDIELPIGARKMRPEEISSLILKKLKAAALEQLALPADTPLRAVITVPAYFSEEQRGATKQAGELAGLQVERIINEPTSAALSFGMSQMEEAKYAVYDFGGGTFDVSVIESQGGLVEVLASTGNNHLGGDDLDELLADFLWKKFLQTNKLSGVEPSRKEKARLIRTAETAKIKLSSEAQVQIQESFFFKINGLNYHLEHNLTRNDFEELVYGKVLETAGHLKKAVEDAKLKLTDLDGILLVGGSSRIPLVANVLQKETGITPVLVSSPDEAVSHGATIQGAIIDDIDIDTILVDITPYSLGIGTLDDLSYILPSIVKEDVPEDASEKEKLDANLLAAVVIPKNTPIPVSRTSIFYNAVPFQKKFLLEVFQGEGKRFHENRQIGEMRMEIPKPEEESQVEVTFTLDLNGMLVVTAIELLTKQVVKATFKSSRGVKMFKTELDQILAGSNKATDNPLLRRAEALLEKKTDLADNDRTDVNDLIGRLKEAVEADDKEALDAVEAELLDLLYYLEGK